jgi:glycosyltransferase involved in cell wall biosynthesis
MFSILILTGNEEINIRECLESVSWCDDVWVLDCGSKDRTVEIAKEMGANVITRPFDNFGNQRNFGIDTCKGKHEWVFDLDADERFTPELKAECEELIKRDEKSAYYVANKMMLMGKCIRRASQFPVYQMRFHKLGEIRFVAHGHGQRE